MSFKLGPYLYASFRFPAIRFGVPTLLSFSDTRMRMQNALLLGIVGRQLTVIYSGGS